MRLAGNALGGVEGGRHGPCWVWGMRSSSQTLRDSLDGLLREARALGAAIERALWEARAAVARSRYGRLVREPRNARDPERGSLARVLRRSRLGPGADKEREARAAGPRHLRGNGG